MILYCQILAKEPNLVVNGKNQDLHVNDSSLSSCGVNQRHLSLKQLYNSTDVMFVDELSDSTTDVKSKSPIGSLNTVDIVMGGGNTEAVPHLPEPGNFFTVSPAGANSGIGVVQAYDENNT